jgi:putative phage-type endonuclease
MEEFDTISISSEAETESLTTDHSINFFDSLNETELFDLQSTIIQLLDDHLNSPELIQMTKPDFHKKLVEEVTNSVFDTLLESGICNEDSYDDLYDFVESLSDVTYDMNMIPQRSYEWENGGEKSKKEYNELFKKIETLKKIKQPQQKTKEWYEFRHGLISASNIYKVFGSESKQNELIYEKCKPVDIPESTTGSVNTESPLHWGNKYEPLTVMVYEKRNQTKIADYGCIPHPKYPFIGASPDGINDDPTHRLYGRMIEIKNIVNREIDGIPSEAYWTQMQIQMETCDLDECDFVETRFKQYSSSVDFWQDTEQKDRGIILYFVRRDAVPCPPLYKYMPLDIVLEEGDVNEWIFNMTNELKDEWILYETHYWYLDEFSCVLVRRNKKWFEFSLTNINEIWNIITKERVEGYEHRAPKKRIKTEVLEGEDGKHYIKNMPQTTSVCLIKLDK